MSVEDHRHIHRGDDGPDPLGDITRQVMPGRIHDPDSLRAETDRLRAFLGQTARVGHVAHKQHGLCLDAQVANKADVPFGHAGLGAVGGDPDNVGTVTDGPADVLAGAPPGCHERGHPGVREDLADGGEHGVVVQPRPADLEEEAPRPLPWPTSTTGMPARFAAWA